VKRQKRHSIAREENARPARLQRIRENKDSRLGVNFTARLVWVEASARSQLVGLESLSGLAFDSGCIGGEISHTDEPR
jgi:hypothetical protein